MGTPDDEAALQMTEEAETAEDLIKERDLKIKMLMSSRVSETWRFDGCSRPTTWCSGIRVCGVFADRFIAVCITNG